jgi:hypothetical protein
LDLIERLFLPLCKFGSALSCSRDKIRPASATEIVAPGAWTFQQWVRTDGERAKSAVDSRSQCPREQCHKEAAADTGFRRSQPPIRQTSKGSKPPSEFLGSLLQLREHHHTLRQGAGECSSLA